VVGSAIKDHITIVSARTFARWKAAEAGEPEPKRKTPARKPG
jgi:hypothetical protein